MRKNTTDDGTKCGRERFERTLARFGDPTLLDDPILSDLFTIPKDTKLCNGEGKEWGETFTVLEKLKLPLKPGPDPDPMLYGMATRLVVSAMGLRLVLENEDNKIRIETEDNTTDFGYGPGAATKARDDWIRSSEKNSSESDTGFRRSRAVMSVIASMMRRSAIHIALELFVLLSEESIFTRKIRECKSARDARAFVSHISKGAPIFSRCMRIFIDDIKKFEESACREREKPHMTIIPDIAERDRCLCGVSFIRVVHFSDGDTRNSDAFAVCAIHAITGTGCKESDVREV